MRSSLTWALVLWSFLTTALPAQELATLKPEGPFASTEVVALSPDGKTVLITGSLGRATLWDVAGGREKALLAGHNGKPITAAVWSRDGKRLATASWDNSVKLWNTETREELATLIGHDNIVLAVAFSPDGKRIASASVDKTVRLWTTAGEMVRSLPAQERIRGRVEVLAFSPDGKILAAGDPFFGNIDLWDVATGQVLGTIKQEGCKGLAFLTEDKLVFGTRDGVVRVWDIPRKEVVAEMKGHDGPITALALLPGRIVATGGHDTTVRLWDLTTEKEKAVLKGHPKAIKTLSASADGKILASGSEGKVVKLWDVDKALGR
jgi:dipeptidyl aminopeptidase/acylaminoacyl peptidase